MEHDLEEGEVVDSDNEEGESKTGLMPTGGANPADSFSWRTEPSRASFSSTSVATVTSTERKPIQRLRRDSCDSASSAEASDSDSDDAPFAKKKCPASRLDVPSSHMPPAAARPATKYNIWGSVLQEQTLSKDLGSWFGMNSKVISDRDVETYDYRNAKNSTANSDGADPPDADIADDCEEPTKNDDEDDVNICDRETFGTSASSEFSKSSERSCSEQEQSSRKRRRNGAAVGLNRQMTRNVELKSARDRLSKRTYSREKDRSHVRVGINDTAVAVGEELVRVLREPEHMKDVFVRVAETLGAEKALELLYCTEDLQEAGGLMTLNGSRRRTAGGVYLFLVKDDPDISREQQNVIFYGSDEERKRQQRESKRRRWRRHRDNITAAESYPPTDDLRPLPDCRNLFLLDRLPSGKAEPSPQLAAVKSGDTCDGDMADTDTAAAAGKVDDENEDEDDNDDIRIELDLA